ncbi:MAG: hypothetical protein AAGG02_10525 [Cyanobacteria bacterium P01_H01_bin.15]
MGNYLAGERVASVIQQFSPCTVVNHYALDDYAPELAEFGYKMRRLGAKAEDEKDRSATYLSLIRDIESLIAARIQKKETPFVIDRELLCRLRQEQENQTALFIFVKGVAFTALQSALHPKTITANFVTNAGLLDLSIHRVFPDYHFVPNEMAQKKVVEFGCESDKVFILGPTIELERPKYSNLSPLNARMACVLLNGDPKNYPAIINQICKTKIDTRLIVISPDSELDLSKGLPPYSEHIVELEILDKLPQQEFRDRLEKMAAHPQSVFISKSGPNSFFEAIGAGLIPIIHWSGLPPEKWVCELANSQELGVSYNSQEELCANILERIDDASFLTLARQKVDHKKLDLRNSNWKEKFKKHLAAILEMKRG